MAIGAFKDVVETNSFGELTEQLSEESSLTRDSARSLFSTQKSPLIKKVPAKLFSITSSTIVRVKYFCSAKGPSKYFVVSDSALNVVRNAKKQRHRSWYNLVIKRFFASTVMRQFIALSGKQLV